MQSRIPLSDVLRKFVGAHFSRMDLHCERGIRIILTVYNYRKVLFRLAQFTYESR